MNVKQKVRYRFGHNKTAGFQTKQNPASEEGDEILYYYRLKISGTQNMRPRNIYNYVCVPPDIILKIKFIALIKIAP